MRLLFVVVFAVTSFMACGKVQENKNNQGPDWACCNTNPTTIKLKTSNGRDFVDFTEVTRLEVFMTTPPGQTPAVQVIRNFFGNDIIKVVQQFNLSKPSDGGAPASLHTGRIYIFYKHPGAAVETVRELTIENERLIEDAQFPSVTYDPASRLTIDWLDSQ